MLWLELTDVLVDWLSLTLVEVLWLLLTDPDVDWLSLTEVEVLWLELTDVLVDWLSLTEVEVLWLVAISVLSNNEWLMLLDSISDFSAERLVDFERLSEVIELDLLFDKLRLSLLLSLFFIESLLCLLCFSDTLVNSLLCLSYFVCWFS